jgi:eukaryotic-like serine/threonine-protein kinase
MQLELIAGRYQMLRAIGQGGMGTVWLCLDQVLGRRVAVKQIGALPGESANETKRAMREARSAAALNHPNVVSIFDVVNHDGRPWLVMEYVEGQTLADEISHAGQLSPQRVADIGSQLAGALARAHERGIVHRDIKPGNVLIDKAGRAKISDFGIARGKGDDQLTQVGYLTGTPGYLSPELARGGDPRSASDVWALGATLYSAVEGRSPYEPRSNPIALLRSIATERPRPMTHAGVVGPAIHEMMLEDPTSRWDMATSARALGRIARVDATAVMPGLEPAGTSVMPMVDVPGTEIVPKIDVPGTAIMPMVEVPGTAVTPELEPAETAVMAVRPVETTKRLEAAAPVAEVAGDSRPEPAGPRNLHPDAPVRPSGDRRSGGRWLLLAFLAFLVTALGTAYLLSSLNNQGGTTAAPGTTRVTTPAKTRAAATTAPRQSTSPQSTSTISAASRSLESFVVSYYSDVTRERDRTWHELTPRMQKAAGGRHGYDGFWKTIDNVEVNQARADAAANQAVVNLTFTRGDGTTSTETHQLTFITGGRGYLIESDHLLG